MAYLKAYHAYVQQNYEQSLNLLQELKQEDTKKLDLLAQIYFQLKEYQKAYDIYQKLILQEDDHVRERKENLQTLIVCAQLEQPGLLKTTGKDLLPSTEDIVDQVEFIDLKDKSVHDLFAKPEQTKRSKKKKKRKVRLPKNYDPVAGPDPERWIPRRDRRGNNQKNKKRRQRFHKK